MVDLSRKPATADNPGEVELATQAEVDAGTAQDKIVTPQTLDDSEQIISKKTNYIINGACDFAQRIGEGGSASGVTDGYFVDRLKLTVRQGGSGVTFGINHAADAPTFEQAGFPFNYSFNVGNQSAVVGPQNGDELWAIDYRMEANDAKNLWGKRFSASFWIKCDVAGTFTCLFFQTDGTNPHSLARAFTINSPGVWQRIEINDVYFDPSVTPLMPGQSTIAGLNMVFVFAAGANRQHTEGEDVWVSRPSLGYRQLPGQTQLWANSSQDVWITGLQINEGSKVASTFTRAGRTIDDELSMCQRYYEKTYDVDVAPGTLTDVGAYGVRGGTSIDRQSMVYRVSKRAAASIEFHNPAVVSNSWRDVSAGNNRTASLEGSTSGHNGFVALCSGLSENNLVRVHWTADAEL